MRFSGWISKLANRAFPKELVIKFEKGTQNEIKFELSLEEGCNLGASSKIIVLKSPKKRPPTVSRK